MNRAFSPALLAASALCLCNCSAAFTKAPLADRTDPILQKELTGTWQHEDGTIQIEFDSKGVGHAASLEWKEDAFSISQGVIQATKINEKNYISFEPEAEDSEDAPPGLLFGLLILSEEQELTIQRPDLKRFEELIKSGKLNGNVKKGKYSTQVVVDDVKPLLNELDAKEKLFTPDEPLRLRRLPTFEYE